MCGINLLKNKEFQVEVAKAQELMYDFRNQSLPETEYSVRQSSINITFQDISNLESFLYEQSEEWQEGGISIGGTPERSYAAVASWTRKFLSYFYQELNNIICDKEQFESVTDAADISVKGIVTAIAAWIVKAFGIVQPLAIGIATAVLLVLFKATKGAFCKMSQEEVEQSLDTIS